MAGFSGEFSVCRTVTGASMDDEMELLEAYMELMCYRYPQLYCRYDIDPDLGGARLPGGGRGGRRDGGPDQDRFPPAGDRAHFAPFLPARSI